jgi:dUTP pyrophosphatase
MLLARQAAVLLAPRAAVGTVRAMVDVPLVRLDPDLPLPGRAREGDAAFDVVARSSVELAPGTRALVPTGIAVALPPGWCGLLLPRSGLAMHSGLTVLNAPGLVDAGYRGELQVLLVNTGSEPVRVQRGERIAQLLVQPVPDVRLVEVTELPPSHDGRGEAGFGSSGR